MCGDIGIVMRGVSDGRGGEDLDRGLLEEMYERYYREIYLYVYSICGRRSMAEDILQETFLKAFIALKDSHTNMRAWLYMVARNLCYNCMRKERAMILLEEVEEKRRVSCDDVLDQVIDDERKREIWDALEKIGGTKKEVLVLQYFGGFRQAEIAAMLHLTPQNVRVLAYRARKELKSYLEVRDYDIP
ncbi:MAG: RNA polymerase sigma factor [Eubacteriales bacterium]|nr:RNA polymerase sigma factor [Eubacteriales bacterium]